MEGLTPTGGLSQYPFVGTVPVRGQSRLVGTQRQAGRDYPAAADGLVDDVDAVVLAIRPGHAQEQGQPAPEPEPPLFGEAPLEDEAVSFAPKIPALLLRNAVQKHLKVRPDTSRKLYARPLGHPP